METMETISGGEMLLEDCRAIKRGWLKALTAFFVHAFLAFVVGVMAFNLLYGGYIVMFQRKFDPSAQSGPLYLLFIGIASLVFFMLLRNQFNSLYSDYWRRNVVGYCAVFYKNGEGKLETEIFFGRKWRDARGDQVKFIVKFILPLGGWLRRSKVVGCPVGWRITEFSIGKAKELAMTLVVLADCSGSSVKLYIEMALEMAKFSCISSCVDYAKETESLLKRRQKSLIDGTLAIVERMKQTTRFFSMLEAHHVARDLLMVVHCNIDHSTRQAQDILSLIEAENMRLRELEKKCRKKIRSRGDENVTVQS